MNYLFANKYKNIGWLILIPSAIVGVIVVITEYEPDFLTIDVPTIFINEWVREKHFFGMVNNNILNEILGVL